MVFSKTLQRKQAEKIFSYPCCLSVRILLLLFIFSFSAVSVFSPVSFALKGSQVPQNKDLTRLCLGSWRRKRRVQTAHWHRQSKTKLALRKGNKSKSPRVFMDLYLIWNDTELINNIKVYQFNLCFTSRIKKVAKVVESCLYLSVSTYRKSIFNPLQNKSICLGEECQRDDLLCRTSFSDSVIRLRN